MVGVVGAVAEALNATTRNIATNIVIFIYFIVNPLKTYLSRKRLPLWQSLQIPKTLVDYS